MTDKFVLFVLVFCLVASAAGEGASRETDEIRADRIITVTDDFIVEVYHNGQIVPDEKRTLLLERYGATVERIDVPLRRGDWLVVNVVNNRFRWNGAYYFAAVGQKGTGEESTVGMTSQVGRQWCACDNPSNVARFIADRDYLRESAAKAVIVPWQDGDGLMEEYAGSSAEAIWGSTRNTWLKLVVE